MAVVQTRRLSIEPGTASIADLQLSGFELGDAAAVASWAVTAEEAKLWSSFDGHPVPAATVAAWGDEPGTDQWTLRDGPEPVGYGELWIDADAGEVELARLIVAPHARNRGVGARLTSALVDVAHDITTEVFLRVHPDNRRALRLYQRVGFTRVPAVDAQTWNIGQPVAYIWMAGPRPN